MNDKKTTDNEQENTPQTDDGYVHQFVDTDVLPDKEWHDDGTTSFADMDSTLPVHKQKHTKRQGVDLNRKEKNAVYWAAVSKWLPAYLSILVGFGLTFALIYWWLS